MNGADPMGAGDAADLLALPPEPAFMGPRNPALPILLALFLILLAFFMALQAVSVRENGRVSATLRGLGKAFSARQPTTVPYIDADPAKLVPDEKLKNGSLSLLAPYLPPGADVSLANGPVLSVIVPVQSLFLDGQEAPRADRTGFIKAIADLVAVQGPAQRRLELLVGTGNRLPAPAAGRAPMEVRRAGRLASAMIRAGAPADSVLTGLSSDSPGDLRLTIYAVVPTP